MRVAAVSGIGLLALALAALPAQADVIRISMQPSSAFGGRSPLDFTGVESAAAAADPLFGSNGSNTWNYITAPPSGTSQVTNPVYSGLLDSAGLTTGVSLSFTGTFDAASDNPLDNNGSNALQNEYFLIGGSTVIDFTISGLKISGREFADLDAARG